MRQRPKRPNKYTVAPDAPCRFHATFQWPAGNGPFASCRTWRPQTESAQSNRSRLKSPRPAKAADQASSDPAQGNSWRRVGYPNMWAAAPLHIPYSAHSKSVQPHDSAGGIHAGPPDADPVDAVGHESAALRSAIPIHGVIPGIQLRPEESSNPSPSHIVDVRSHEFLIGSGEPHVDRLGRRVRPRVRDLRHGSGGL